MKKSLSATDIIWRAEEYHDLSFAQTVAATSLIEKLTIPSSSRVLDVGCGNGRISANIAKIACNGKVLGVDKSIEMVNFAIQTFSYEHYPNLSFKVQSAEDISYENEFDLVFSSFCLQWVEEKNSFLKKTYKALTNQGKISLIIPLGISPELEESIEFVTKKRKWFLFFKNFFPKWFFSSENSIKHLVQENGFKINYCSSAVQEVFFPSKQAFEKYILLWFPYLQPLPQERRNSFFKEVLDYYFSILPVQENMSVMLRIPRLDLIGEKVIL